ncbi:MAG TPA: serine/threonine protein phosphatase [Firmicutes bacterium]|jgi:hypothetical protein|nr:serine/threonine protein phosphatase [Bacillota bacterium]
MFIDTGWSSLPKFGEELCGDNVEVAKTADAVVAVLADGLGSGVKANILSKMTAKIIVTMLEKGASLEEVVDTIGNTLPICQKRLLAYSTFTIIHAKENGEVYIIEFDNPSVFFIHGGQISTVSFREIEVLGKKIKETRFQASPGDILVAVSDGVVHAGIGGVLNLGWQWENVAEYLQRMAKPVVNAKSMSRVLLTVSEELYAGRPGDDATVMVLQIRNPRTVTVAVGPPRAKDDDRVLMEKLQAETGKKVVCGGTTGTIVARYLQKEIMVDINKLDPEVPPTGNLPGIDLVTEGIITLNKTLEYLRVAHFPEQVPAKDNGAVDLAKILLEGDEINFIVGRAINPAHQNPDLPLSLGMKIKAVDEISNVLSSLGKQVTVQYL